MKTMAAVAVAMVLAGCAAGGNGNGNGGSHVAQAAAGSGMSYCIKDKLVTEGDKLVCNWARTTKEACENMATTSLPQGSVASGPDRSTMCANGTALVRVTTK